MARVLFCARSTINRIVFLTKRTRGDFVSAKGSPVHAQIANIAVSDFDKLCLDHHLIGRAVQLLQHRPNPVHPRGAFSDNQTIAPRIDQYLAANRTIHQSFDGGLNFRSPWHNSK